MIFTAVSAVFSKYATFTGRASRPEFWYWVLSVFIVMAVLNVIDGAIIAPMLGYESFADQAPQFLTIAASIAIFLPGLAVAIRRLHDIGKAGWWVLVGLIPLIGTLVLLYFNTRPSENDANEYGAPNPL